MELEHLKKGASIPARNGQDIQTKPPWLDEERFELGKKFMKDHLVVHLLALYCSLLSGLSVANLLTALVFTDKSHTPRRSFLRYIRTYTHIVWWIYGNIWDPNDNAYKSISVVRKMHSNVSQAMLKKTGNLYISQYDLAVVQCGFMGVVTMYPKGFGLAKISQKELEDFIYFWRCIGYLLGILDEYNICSGNFHETFSICKEIENDLVLPSMKRPPKHFQNMANAFSEGFRSILTTECTLAFMYHTMGLAKPQLNFMDNLRLNALCVYVFCIAYLPGFEKILNKFVHWTIKKYFMSETMSTFVFGHKTNIRRLDDYLKENCPMEIQIGDYKGKKIN